MKVSRPKHLWALDFFRVLAFLGVFFYHLIAPLVPGGYFGVVGFFVLAGYLSMRKVILAPKGSLHRQSTFDNLCGRVSRIYPQLLTFLCVISVLMLLFFPQFLDLFQRHVQASVLSLNNIWQIFAGESYFEGAGYLKPLTHLWALSLEFQFYLLFGLLVYPFYHPRRNLEWGYLFFFLSALSAMLYFFFYPLELDPSRVYYGLDTRLFSFTTGMLAALIVERPQKRVPRHRLKKTRDPRWLITQGGLILVSILLLLSYLIPFPDDFGLRYGLYLSTLLWTLALTLGSQSNNLFEALGASLPIRYLASRSYLLYLWHYPVFLMSERFLAFSNFPFAAIFSLKIVLSLAVTELFWQLGKLLKPFVNRSYPLVLAPLTGRLKPFLYPFLKPSFWLSLLLSCLLIFAPWQYLYEVTGGAEMRQMEEDLKNREAKIKEELARREAERQKAALTVPQVTTQLETKATSEKKEVKKGPGGWPIKGRITVPEAVIPAPGEDWQLDEMLLSMAKFNHDLGGDYTVDMEQYMKYRDLPLSMIGDSMSVIVSYHIDPYLPNLYLNALSNRQTDELFEVYQDIKEKDALGEVLVIALGTNGEIRTDVLEKVWKDVNQEKPILLFTIVLPYALEEQGRNKDLRDFAKKHEMVWLVEWNLNAKAYPHFFQDDSIHPSDAGCKAFCQLLTAKLVEVLDLYEASGLLDFTRVVSELIEETGAESLETVTDPSPSSTLVTSTEGGFDGP